MKSVYLPALVLPILAASFGCSRAGNPDDPVVAVKKDDTKMNAAIEKAKSTVPQFIKVLRSHGKHQTDFSIKHPYKDGEHTEHMWINDLTYDGKAFHGTVGNYAEQVSNVKFGDKADIPATDISDWMYVENGKLVGGYTIRAMRDPLSAKEKADFDASLPFKID